MTDEQPEGLEPEGEEEPEFRGVDELLYSLGQALRAKESKQAIAKLIAAFAEDVDKRTELRRRALTYGYALSAFIFVVVAVVGYLKVISSELTATLFAALLGYLFIQRRN